MLRPFTSWRVLSLLTLGAWFTCYENFIAGALAVFLPMTGVFVTTSHGGWNSGLGLFMASFPFGMLLGTVFLGSACDYLGRRRTFILMLLLFSLASFSGGTGYYPVKAVLGPEVAAALLILTRFLTGLGVGAEIIILDAYVSETTSPRWRGRAMAILQAFAFTAVPVGSLFGRLLADRDAPDRWWLLLVIGSVGAVATFAFLRWLPESPLWREVQQRVLPTDVNPRSAKQCRAALLPLREEATPRRSHFQIVWTARYRRRTVLLVLFHLLWPCGYYGFMHWLPTLLIAKQFSTPDAFSLQLFAFMLAPVGPVLGALTVERWERKTLITALALVMGGTMVAVGAVDGHATLTLLAALMVTCCNWFCAAFHVYQAELFPTEARGTGVGFCFGWSRGSIVVLDLFMPAVMATSLQAAVAIMAGPMFAVATLIGMFGPRTNNRPLETLASLPGLST